MSLKIENKNTKDKNIVDKRSVVEVGDVCEDVAVVREELEELLFDESNKVNTATKRIILSLFQKVEKTVNILKEENIKLKILAEHQQINKSYSQVVSMGNSGVVTSLVKKPKTEHKLIIKPKQEGKIRDSNEMKNILFNEIKSKENIIRIKNLRNLKDKTIILDLEGEEDIKVIKSQLENSNILMMRQPGKILPRIILYDVPTEIKDDVLIEKLIDKNLPVEYSKDDFLKEIKVLFKIKPGGKNADSKKGLNNVVLGVSGRVRNYILGQERVFVGFRSFRVQEFISVTRCYKCQGYGHTSAVCRRETEICGHCAMEGHGYKQCPNKAEEAKCYNCGIRKKPNNHEVTSKKCMEYVKNMEIYKSRISYE